MRDVKKTIVSCTSAVTDKRPPIGGYSSSPIVSVWTACVRSAPVLRPRRDDGPACPSGGIGHHPPLLTCFVRRARARGQGCVRGVVRRARSGCRQAVRRLASTKAKAMKGGAVHTGEQVRTLRNRAPAQTVASSSARAQRTASAGDLVVRLRRVPPDGVRPEAPHGRTCSRMRRRAVRRRREA